MIKKTIFIGFLSFTFISKTFACTVWGAILPNEILIAKNRDYYPEPQVFKTVKPKHGYAFFGLYGNNKIKMGINENGLVVFMTFASTIPSKQRHTKISYDQVMENILTHYDNVNEIKTNAKKLFHDSTPINYVFADRKQAMTCEIGLKNHFECRPYLRISHNITTFAQTNHYLLPSLTRYNFTPVINQQTSYLREIKIVDLMNENIDALSFDKFIQFSLNTEAKNDSPSAKFDVGFNNTYQDNSIFRTFNAHPDRKNPDHVNSDQDVSTMIIELPKDKKKPIKLYLRIINAITDTYDKSDTQNIDYIEAVTTLDSALQHEDKIQYDKKSCQRNKDSISCKEER